MNSLIRFRQVSRDLPSELIDLAQAMETLPTADRDRLAPLMKRVMEGTVRRRRIMWMVQDVLSQLRLDMKYLLFDLEATRRERDAAVQAGADRDEDDHWDEV